MDTRIPNKIFEAAASLHQFRTIKPVWVSNNKKGGLSTAFFNRMKRNLFQCLAMHVRIETHLFDIFANA